MTHRRNESIVPVAWAVICLSCIKQPSTEPATYTDLQVIIQGANLESAPIAELSNYVDKSKMPSEALWFFLGTSSTDYQTLEQILSVQESLIQNLCLIALLEENYADGRYEFECSKDEKQPSLEAFQDTVETQGGMLFYPILYYLLHEHGRPTDKMTLDDAIFLLGGVVASHDDDRTAVVPEEIGAYLDAQNNPRFREIVDDMPSDEQRELLNDAELLMQQLRAGKDEQEYTECAQMQQLRGVIQDTIRLFGQYGHELHIAFKKMLDDLWVRPDVLGISSTCPLIRMRDVLRPPSAREQELRPICSLAWQQSIVVNLAPETDESCRRESHEWSFDLSEVASSLSLNIEVRNPGPWRVELSRNVAISIKLSNVMLDDISEELKTWILSNSKKLGTQRVVSLSARLNADGAIEANSSKVVELRGELANAIDVVLRSCLVPPREQPMLVDMFRATPDAANEKAAPYARLTSEEADRHAQLYMRRKLNAKYICPRVAIEIVVTDRGTQWQSVSEISLKELAAMKGW